jgi:glycosyltransferase involved in cell wall biosynthesis
MASGCLTFCYQAGGPKEVINHKKTGFLFNDEKSLIKDMVYCLNNQKKAEKIISNGQSFVKTTFNYQKFKNRVKKILT